jgi:competence protein ComEC
VPLAPGTFVEVLWPPPARDAPELSINDRSLVLRLVTPGRSVLLTGDVGPDVQAALAALPPERLAADVLLLPHHGSYTPALPGFLRAVGATLLVQSSAFREDREELRAALVGRTRKVTFRDGYIEVDLRKPPPAGAEQSP